MVLASDDDVVEHLNVHHLRCLVDLSSNHDVLAAWYRITGWVIVYHDDRRVGERSLREVPLLRQLLVHLLTQAAKRAPETEPTLKVRMLVPCLLWIFMSMVYFFNLVSLCRCQHDRVTLTPPPPTGRGGKRE